MSGFTTPLRAELPLDGLEAFRLASFGLEYVPQYAPVTVDEDCNLARVFNIPAEHWPSLFPMFPPGVTAAYRNGRWVRLDTERPATSL